MHALHSFLVPLATGQDYFPMLTWQLWLAAVDIPIFFFKCFKCQSCFFNIIRKVVQKHWSHFKKNQVVYTKISSHYAWLPTLNFSSDYGKSN